MLITPDTITNLKTRLGAELAQLQAAMIASPRWSPAENHDFGPTAESVIVWVNAPVRYMSLAADYNDGISRRNTMLAWWKRLVDEDPDAPPVPDSIRQSGGTPDPLSGATSLVTAATTLVLVLGVVYVGAKLLTR